MKRYTFAIALIPPTVCPREFEISDNE